MECDDWMVRVETTSDNSPLTFGEEKKHEKGRSDHKHEPVVFEQQ